MQLDPKTIYVVGATIAFILGCVQILAYATGRFERWPLWWGLSNLLLGLGVLGTAFRGLIPDFVSIELANIVLWCGLLTLHLSVRSFAGASPQLRVYAASTALLGVLLFLWNEPEHFSRRVMLVSLFAAACDAAIVHEAWKLARRERLASAWILLCLFAMTGLAWLWRGGLAAFGMIGETLFPERGTTEQWLQVAAAAILIMRSSALLLLASERSGNRLLALAQHDALTGAMNRTGFERALAEFAGPDAARRVPARICLLAVDIDRFKDLNDTHGHSAGDTVLRLFAATARRQLRGSDLLVRQGGDEFAIVLPDASLAQATEAAQRIRRAFAAEAKALKLTRTPTLSIGIAEGDPRRHSLEALLVRADQALYRSKHLGRDRIQTETTLDA